MNKNLHSRLYIIPARTGQNSKIVPFLALPEI
jgi:hypothetical protein